VAVWSWVVRRMTHHSTNMSWGSSHVKKIMQGLCSASLIGGCSVHMQTNGRHSWRWRFLKIARLDENNLLCAARRDANSRETGSLPTEES
jgi:hypothetical protein